MGACIDFKPQFGAFRHVVVVSNTCELFDLAGPHHHIKPLAVAPFKFLNRIRDMHFRKGTKLFHIFTHSPTSRGVKCATDA